MTMRFIGWTLIHSLWQGGVIAAFLAAAFAATRRSAASVRYALGLAGLALMVVLPIATSVRIQTTESALKSTAALSRQGPLNTAGATASQNGVAAAPAAATIASGGEVGSNGIAGRSGQTLQIADAISGVRGSILGFLEPILPWLVRGWLIGLFILSVRMIGGVARTRRITREGTSPASDGVLRVVRRLSDELGLHRVVRALEGNRISVPVVIGWLQPVIVLPASLVTGLTPLQLEMLLAHEIAHIRRYDFVVNILQTVVETLMFYHPAARWLSDRIREERENCCDDVAVSLCGGDTKAYTTTLLVLEEWRGVGFAAAATGGGTLLRRAMRLMKGEPAHLDLGARWIAGIITILAVLLTTGPAMGIAGVLSLGAPMEVTAFFATSPDTVRLDSKGGPDAARSKPDTVIRYAGAAAFDDRWKWAQRRADELRFGKYWIGYLVAGDPTGHNLYYSDRLVPMRVGESVMTGKAYIGGDLNGMQFSGVALEPLVGNHSPRSTAIFLELERSGGGTRLTRVHVGSFALPVYFDSQPAIWLDSATDAESVGKLRDLGAMAGSLAVRRDLVSAVGAHRDANIVLPVLVGWVDSRSEPEEIRREAVEALSEQADPRAVAVLARVARGDRDSDVRREAIEALESMRLESAADTLMAFVRTLDSYDFRRVAVESLGSRHEPRVIVFLGNLARGNSDMRLRIDAVESLGSIHEDAAFATIAELARRGPDSQIRHKAVEEIGNNQDAGRALSLLVDIIRNESDESIKLKAVETVADVHDASTVKVLRDLALQDRDPRVQLRAAEALGNASESKDAADALVSLARSHSRPDVRLKAVEALGNLHDEPAAGAALIQIARSSSDPDMQLKAVEALGDLRTTQALDALQSIARNSGSSTLRRHALETYADNADARAAVAFLTSVINGNGVVQSRLDALEVLSELNDDVGVSAVRDLARSSSDPSVRSRAQQLLADR